MAPHPCSGEINCKVEDTQASIEVVKAHFALLNPIIDSKNGNSLEFSNWRFNLRDSNTEPLLRLNVKARGDSQLVLERVAEIKTIIKEVT
jgi:phosphomannomutase